MKTCGKCKVSKSFDEFSKNKSKADGLQGLCKICKGISQRKYYTENKTTYQQQSSIARAARKKLVRQFVIDYLVKNPCVDCGQTDVHVLEFDHVRGTKVSGIGRMISDGLSTVRVQKEIDKCEVRCCNCHRKATFSRAGVDFTEYL